MSPRDVPENSVSSVSMMSDADEVGDGFVIVQYNGDEGSDNEPTDSSNAFEDPHCNQITAGYSLLSQDEGQENDYSGESDDEVALNGVCSSPGPTERQVDEGTETSPACMSNNEECSPSIPTDFSSSVMTKEEEDLVKEAMSGFVLPIGNIPPWASAIPEGEWMKSLTSDILKRE